MALMETGIYYKLAGDTAVAAIVGKRIYPLRLPQKASYPAIAYTRISGFRYNIMVNKSGLAAPRFQISCWATTYTAVKTLADKVRLALDSVAGSWGSVTVRACIFEGDNDVIDDDPATGKRYYGVHMDFEITHAEAVS